MPRPLDVAALRAAFVRERPFNHAVIDAFFDDDFARELHAGFPRFDASQKTAARVFSGRVFGPPPAAAGPAIAAAFRAMADRGFARSISEVTGVTPLAIDETNAGAGMHVGLAGSALPIHADHNTHPAAPWLYRRINLLVYLNPKWEPSWRSNLLLYDADGKRLVKEIEPRFNRAVLMEVHDRAFHGYRPLDVPAGESRQSLAAYFYSTVPAPEQATHAHGTIVADPLDIGLLERLATRARMALVTRFPQLLPRGSWRDPHA